MTSLVELDLTNPVLNAALALDVYRDPENIPQIPAGWQRYMDCPVELQKDGYFGAAYINVQHTSFGPQNVFIIIAHRGTANVAGVIDDIKMFLHDTIPAQFKSAAIPFIDCNLTPSLRKFLKFMCFNISSLIKTGEEDGDTNAIRTNTLSIYGVTKNRQAQGLSSAFTQASFNSVRLLHTPNP